MVAPCRSVNSDKTFSTMPDRNKHEKSKGHGPNDTLGPTSLDTSMKIYTCPVPNCSIFGKKWRWRHSPISCVSTLNLILSNKSS